MTWALWNRICIPFNKASCFMQPTIILSEAVVDVQTSFCCTFVYTDIQSIMCPLKHDAETGDLLWRQRDIFGRMRMSNDVVKLTLFDRKWLNWPNFEKTKRLIGLLAVALCACSWWLFCYEVNLARNNWIDEDKERLRHSINRRRTDVFLHHAPHNMNTVTGSTTLSADWLERSTFFKICIMPESMLARVLRCRPSAWAHGSRWYQKSRPLTCDALTTARWFIKKENICIVPCQSTLSITPKSITLFNNVSCRDFDSKMNIVVIWNQITTCRLVATVGCL